MSFLVLYIGERRKFEEQAVTTALQGLIGATSLGSSNDCLSAYQYQKGNDLTTIRFTKDRETIVIDGLGEASLSAALHIQSGYPEDIHVIDEGYSFDLNLRESASPLELEQRIRNASG